MNPWLSIYIPIATTLLIGVIGYFLKRTVTRVDEIERDVRDIRENYIVKEDFFREQQKTDRKLDRIMDILLEMKGDRT